MSSAVLEPREMAGAKQIFCESQRTTASHPKLLKKLMGIYTKSDLNPFVSAFTNLLKKSLIHGDKQPACERTLEFVAKFATMKKDDHHNKNEETEIEENEEAEDEADMFLVHLIQFLLNNHEANSQAVRFRVCQLINKILNHMGEEAVIDDDLYSSIYDTMLHRLQDRVPVVRVQAVLAVARLQDPRNKECPVIKAYRYHLSMDPNPDVRRAVLTSTAITFQTLPDILERTRDVNTSVRREAYKVLSQKVHIRSLTIAQRVRLISEGLKDRSDTVRTTVEKHLIQSWLRMVNGNVLDLLVCLDVEASVAEAELALKTMFRDVPFPDLIENFGLTKDERIVNSSELRPESALYWRCIAQHLRDEGAEDALDTIIPELTKFCTYVHDYAMTEVKDNGDAQEMAVQCMEREFVTNQLITMTMLYDLSDEVGRRSLDKLVRNLLVSDKIAESLVKGLVEVFGKLHPPTTRVNQLAEIISEVREPATATKSVVQPISDEEQRKKKLQAARIKVRMNQVREEIDKCVRLLDFGKAQLLKEELEELETELSLINLDSTTTEEVPNQEERSDPTTLSKCLMIVCHMVENPDITVMTPTLYSLNENLLLPCLRSEDPAVRNQGVKALGLFCLLSNDLAKQHLVLFLQISRIDVEQIQLSSLRCVIDLLHLYGLDEFTEAAEDIVDVSIASTGKGSKEIKVEKEVEEEEEGGVIISALCQMMDSESVEVRTQAAEGLCKLLLASRITSSKLLSHLILMWYNPATEDDSLLRHMLGVFFPLYASFGGTNQESMCAAVLPTLQALFNAPSRSPLSDVNVDDVATFLTLITSPTFTSGESSEQVNTHDTLVFTLCTEILANPDNSWTKVLIRILTNLNLTPTNYSTLRQVKVLADKMMKKVKERVCQNLLDRFNTMVLNHLKNAPEPNPDENEKKDISVIIEESAANISEIVLTPRTLIRKKRMLYNQTCSDLELFSSGVESDGETPVKRHTRLTLQVIHSDELTEIESLDLSAIGSPKDTSTQKKDEEIEGTFQDEEIEGTFQDEEIEGTLNEEGNTVICRPVGDTELELSPKVIEDQDSKMKASQKRTKKQRSPTSGESSQEETKSPRKIPRTSRTRATVENTNQVKIDSRRRTKQQAANTDDSSEGETTVPSKVPRTARLSDTACDGNTGSAKNVISAGATLDDSTVSVKSVTSADATLDGNTELVKNVSSADTTRDGNTESVENVFSADNTRDGNTESVENVSSADNTRDGNTESVENVISAQISRDNSQSSSTSDKEVFSSENTDIIPVKRITRNRSALALLDQKTSRLSSEGKTTDSESVKTRSTRSSTSSKSAEITSSNTSSATGKETSPQVRRSGRKGSNSVNVTHSNQSRRTKTPVENTQSSQSSLSTTQTSSTSKDITPPMRKSTRNLAGSQSTDSESEVTQVSGRKSSRRKGSKK